MSAAYTSILEVFNTFCYNRSTAYFHIEGDLSYQTLFDNAAVLAKSLFESGREPILIYGHKSCSYLVAYWACILAGRTFVPIETDNHQCRISSISTVSGASLVLNTTSSTLDGLVALPVKSVLIDSNLSSQKRKQIAHFWKNQPATFSDEDTMYMMFSSGTTGSPKGILVSYGNTADFIDWLKQTFPLIGPISGNIRYCFDVSLYELWLAWINCQPISSLDHREIINTRKAIQRHHQYGTTTWVSTPSMTAYYLKDHKFDAKSLPSLTRFIFCGEVLSKSLVNNLRTKFPEANIINTYGPTECTVAVTSIEIQQKHLTDSRPLPVGQVRPNSQVLIAPHSHEILIQGASVGNGYLGAESNQAKFVTLEPLKTRRYHTGDLGQLDGNILYFLGRSDREIKVQGYRVDLNIIEKTLLTMQGIEDAFVEPWIRKGQFHSLRVFVKAPPLLPLSHYAYILSTLLPPYMVPKFWYTIDTYKLNLNSKLDRISVAETAVKQGEYYVFNNDSVNY